MIAWHMSAEVAMKFFELCRQRNANTEEERIAILFELKDEMDSVFKTDRTLDQFLKDKAKHCKVLHVRSDESV